MDINILRDREACCTLSQSTFQDAMISLLLAIADSTGEPAVPTEHTFATAGTSPVQAGAYSVTIQVSSGPSVVNGISIPTNGSLTLTADNGKVLPEVVITGGTYVWGAIL